MPEAAVVVDAVREVVAGVSRDVGPGALEARVATGGCEPEEGWGCVCAEASGMGSEVDHMCPRPVLAWKWRRDSRRVLAALMKSAETPPVAARSRAMATVGFDPGGNMPQRRCAAIDTSATDVPRVLRIHWSVTLRNSQSIGSNGMTDGSMDSAGVGRMGGDVIPVVVGVWVGAPGTVWVGAPGTGWGCRDGCTGVVMGAAESSELISASLSSSWRRSCARLASAAW